MGADHTERGLLLLAPEEAIEDENWRWRQWMAATVQEAEDYVSFYYPARNLGETIALLLIATHRWLADWLPGNWGAI